MLRIAFSLFFWVSVARWCYQEVLLVAPELTPYIDSFIEHFAIPTHDQWGDFVIDLSSGELRIRYRPDENPKNAESSHKSAKRTASDGRRPDQKR
ncbi:MAG: hypothetical protein KDD60_08505 [Bdellovibrionales bacterium]|nr:hypothetical protein [Bdellovibrionales bacterium]